MDEKLESKLVEVETRFNDLMGQMADPAIANDYARFAELNKQRNDLDPVIEKFREFKGVQSELAGNEELAAGDDSDLAEMAKADLEPLRAKTEKRLSISRDWWSRSSRGTGARIRRRASFKHCGWR